MAHSFKNILIPVDLSINTEVAIRKALELTDRGALIHLLYVEHNGICGLSTAITRYFTSPQSLFVKDAVKKILEEWKVKIEETAIDVKVCLWTVVANSIHKTIERKAVQLGVDLIIIGKNSHHSWFPFLNTVVPAKMVEKTGIPVLTVKPGAIRYKVKTVVIPIVSDSNRDKMEIISTLCRKFKVNIHLVTFANGAGGHTDFNASSLIQAYRCIKLVNHYSVEYAVLRGSNKARSILNYAKKINADILLVHPGTETKIGWPNKNISDMLPASSRMHVLAV